LIPPDLGAILRPSKVVAFNRRKGATMKRIALLTVLAVSVLAATAAGHVWHINSGGTGDVATIQDGINAAGAGDTLLLADGTYTGPGNVSLWWGYKDLTIMSESGNPQACVIDCEGLWRALICESLNHGALLEGVTLANAYYTYWDGGAVYCDSASHLTFSNCIFRDNVCEGAGGAIWIDGADPTFIGCTFYGNSARSAGAIKIDGGDMYPHGGRATFTSCFFLRNSALYNGGAVDAYEGEQTFTNCTFSHNSAMTGGALYLWNSSAILTRCIVAYSPYGEGVYCDGSPTPVLTCCDIYGNAGGDYVTCLSGLEGVDGNFSACPSFCNVEIDDFFICDLSPCAPGNHPTGYVCGLIGALEVGCSCGPSQTEASTWGGVKSLYR
jgi:hypothetical protein